MLIVISRLPKTVLNLIFLLTFQALPVVRQSIYFFLSNRLKVLNLLFLCMKKKGFPYQSNIDFGKGKQAFTVEDTQIKALLHPPNITSTQPMGLAFYYMCYQMSLISYSPLSTESMKDWLVQTLCKTDVMMLTISAIRDCYLILPATSDRYRLLLDIP